ncbi:hypothetical protein F4780DRAFT_493061 [Xylariomycetidae sp. FL0641]|nr:hypothetical protein F4780DRAFT_493061 [Xylariomycetidae sp. FL0641]
METMDSTLDKAAKSTINLLEERISNIEHLLYGHSAIRSEVSATRGLQQLEQRLSTLTQRVRVYAELLKLYKSQPSLFHASSPSDPPLELSDRSLQSLVLACASSFPATASSLSSIADTPVPDLAESAQLIALMPRMKGLAATQVAQAAEVSELRARSEALVHRWYADDLMRYSEGIGDLESRLDRVDREVAVREKGESEV